MKDAGIKEKKNLPLPNDRGEGESFPIVGVGASAGGLEAFQQLLSALPRSTGMAFVLIQHLDPKHKSALTEILAKSTSMPVIEVKEGMKVEKDHVYVIPPNTNLSLSREGHLRLVPRSLTHGQHLPVNCFLTSLAKVKREHSIGVILSGFGADGALGIQSIKSEGGLTFAQDEKSAKYDQMPLSAIATACVDFVLEPAEIARHVVRIGLHPFLLNAEEKSPAKSVATSGDSREEPEEFAKILLILMKYSDVDFTQYKESTIKRRILKRMVFSKLETLEAYRKLLTKNTAEVESLYNDILINVTAFFRDKESFEFLKEMVIPVIMKRSSDELVRIWVPGCSTGEEAYSVAMSLLEFLDGKTPDTSVQIFATDISERAIEKARLGIYSGNSLEKISPDRLQRFFVKRDGGYQISKSIRDMCVFATQNVTADPPFSRIDLISCRNLLIYLNPALQKKVFPLFHYALRDKGYLFLGASETIGNFTDLFQQLDKKNKVYLKKATINRPRFEFPLNYQLKNALSPAPEEISQIETVTDIKRDAERYLLNHCVPVGVIVNDSLEILHTMGELGPYLTLNQGPPSLNVAKLAREGLATELRTLVQKVRREGTALKSKPIRIKSDRSTKNICIEVISLGRSRLGGQSFLILFRELFTEKSATTNDKRKLSSYKKGKMRRGGALLSREEMERELSQTRNSLRSLKENLHSSLEGQEAVNEELKSANEEILSSNEELQSTNEELETAKEELQSSNEELTTVNDELQNRNSELHVTNNDLMNLIGSVRVPVVMLGGDLRIRRFTPLAENLFNLIASDIGRPLTDITPNLTIPHLETMIREVMETFLPQEFEVKDQKNRWYSLRVHPYRTSDNKIDGTVLMLVDIHGLKQSRDIAESIVQTVREPLVALNQELRVMTANRSFYETYGGTREETDNQLIYDLGKRQWDIPKLRELLGNILPTKTILNDYEVVHDFKTIGKRTMLLNARRIELESAGMKEMILLAIEDITERKKNENLIRAALKEKEILIKEIHHRVKNNLNIVSSLLDLQADSIKDETALDAFKQSQNRIHSIALIHEKLYESIDLARINFKEYVQELISSVMNTFGIDTSYHSLLVEISDIRLSIEIAIPCSLIINELISNSLKHAFRGGIHGKIWISLKAFQTPTGRKFELILGDNGNGFPQGLDFRNTKSLGLQLVITLVTQLDGEIELLPEKEGVAFRISFNEPKLHESQEALQLAIK